MTTTKTTATPPARTPRAEETRKRIYDCALELFREQGFEQTTMRDIARKADVALGAAYYDFASKEAIVMAFYRELQETSQTSVAAAMQSLRKTKDRIRCVLDERFATLTPNRKFCDALFRHAPNSKDPLSPFSEETRAIRETAMDNLRLALEGGDVKVPADLKPHLPFLLWLYQMGLILFWLYDRSPRQARTHQLTEKSLGFLVNLIRISSLPLMKPLRRNVLDLVEAINAR